MGRLFDGMVSDLCQVATTRVVGLVLCVQDSRDEGSVKWRNALDPESSPEVASPAREAPAHG